MIEILGVTYCGTSWITDITYNNIETYLFIDQLNDPQNNLGPLYEMRLF
jgi:hypothetical protein